nr:M23 family metallopeptidase [Streptomyces zingiberis]
MGALFAVWLLLSSLPGVTPPGAETPLSGSPAGRAGAPADPGPEPDHDSGGAGPAGSRSEPDLSDGERAWPVDGAGGGRVPGGRPEVPRGWEPPPSRYAAGHRGVDLAAREGGPVRAAAPGRVSFAGVVAGRPVVSVELDGTGEPPLRTTYQPVVALVEKGEKVDAGEVVGVLARGPYHCAVSCLHWGLLRGDDYLNPLSLLPAWILRGPPSRLLPVIGVPEPPG